ncbi:MAG: YHS domain-containing (seleno)protein [Sumerlaeia bacterium]
MSVQRYLPLIVAAALMVCGCGALNAQSTNKTMASAETTMAPVALDGYSVVSYQQRAKAEKGSPRYATVHDGQTYYFTDGAERDAFLAEPNRYLPAFDGWCAYGIAKNAKFESNPRTFKVVGGRTFLFLNDGETNTYDLWNGENEQRLCRAANANWETMTGEAPLAHYNLAAGSTVGIHGYSPVAYFTRGKAVKGNPAYAATYRGVTYHFASRDEVETFKQNPSKYEPAYGGWCATGMMIEQKLQIDPETFKIVDNRLFLYKNDAEVNALHVWNKGDEAEQVAKADGYWESLLGE